MRVRSVAVTVLALALLVAPAVAEATTPEVRIEFAAYGPSRLDVLPGETVTWTNTSERTHTVTSDTGLFDSGQVVGDGQFAFRFDEAGTYRYHCTIHPSIVGEIDVRRVILGPLPTATVPVGAPVQFTGRTADPTQPVRIEYTVGGSAFTTAGTATPAPDGNWTTTVAAAATGDYRAAVGTDSSQKRRLLVSIRRVRLRATRIGVHVAVTPSAPYARILVETYQRERFGWWPVLSRRLDYVSEAEIPLRPPTRVRVMLVDRDGWTPLATSRVLVLRHTARPRARTTTVGAVRLTAQPSEQRMPSIRDAHEDSMAADSSGIAISWSEMSGERNQANAPSDCLSPVVRRGAEIAE